MSSLPPSVSDSGHTHASELPCPALDFRKQWDHPDALRGTIYVAERLIAHAVELAKSHGTPSLTVASGRLWPRFLAVRSQIDDAYKVLADRVKDNHDPSPAEEWLLENSHVVSDQIREIKEDLPRGYLLELPRIASGAMRGYPRVYALCLDYLRHTDARLDLSTLSDYVLAYQTEHPLTIGELWAVPIMLRLGLLLSVGALAASEAQAGNRARALAWVERLLASRDSTRALRAELAELERGTQPVSPPFLVHFERILREHDDAALGIAFDWISAQAEKLGTSLEELARSQHLKQAADQVSVGNAVTSMRAVAALDWNDFFERTSHVEAVLREDPFGTYAVSDPATCDRYRHAVEAIARRAQGGEIEVARAALKLARDAHAANPHDIKRAHVGYYLTDEGRVLLNQRVRYRTPWSKVLTNAIQGYPALFYFGLALPMTLAIVGLVLLGARTAGFDVVQHPLLSVTLALLSLFPATEISLTLTQSLTTLLLRPRLLPRLALDNGVPPDLRTLVVIPCLLDSPATVAELLEDLEVRSLANNEKNLHFALLTDFSDADREEHPADTELLRAALEGIAALNERYPERDDRYWLLHRGRRFNPSEGVFMGWERKRGKLEELNRLLRGARDTSFSCVSAPIELFRSIRYVITLDADTELPRDTARELIATLAHPLNHPEYDPQTQRVVRGYAIAQPRIGTLPLSSRRSRYAALAAGTSGIDPYTTAVSDVYQDLFAEGSYTGKAIYDVDAFAAALENRAPENALLSHDLFESFFARSALVTDIELLDEQPATYEVHAGRQHRWMRGDWQLLGWLLPRVRRRTGASQPNDLRLLDRWKLFDNLRRSLVPPATVVLCLVCWSTGAQLAAVATALLASLLSAPLLTRLVLAVTRKPDRTSSSRFSGLAPELARDASQVLVNLSLLLDQALLCVDAIRLALYRLWWSKRRLLEWTAMRQAGQAASAYGISRRMLFGAVLALGVTLWLALAAPQSLAVASLALMPWLAAPLLARWLSKPIVPKQQSELLDVEEQQQLRLVARKTWRFFDRFVTAEEHDLPPDNYQEEPRGVIAHRTSPTNIGLYLLSALSAHDLGILTVSEFTARVHRTMDTLDRLPKRDGHLFNWYDTSTLHTLAPEYVSTVDSGNLAAYLWTLASACSELQRAPLIGNRPFRAIADALNLAALHSDTKNNASFLAKVHHLEQRAHEGGRVGSEGLLTELATLTGLLEALQGLQPVASDQTQETIYWVREAERTAFVCSGQINHLAPCLALVAKANIVFDDPKAEEIWAQLRSKLLSSQGILDLLTAQTDALSVVSELDEVANTEGRGELIRYLEETLREGVGACQSALADLARVASRCTALADGMSFRFLFDSARELFVTGYNVSSARLDNSHYDLLASEARLASLLAIAKGDVPQEHWFRLGRPRARVASGRSLLSWSGSMFEYLMPLLVTRCPPQTLLHETMQAAVDRQRAYGAERRTPWGISESAYNVMDLEMTYQYRAFGVPGLGLKAGLAEDLVVAPYATLLATLVDPRAAVGNLPALTRAGLVGQFGFFEAIDYSPTRLPPGKRGVVVKSFMAHHLGMSLVAINNVLNDNPMQRRFHADPRIKASELLLEERIPTNSPLLRVSDAALVSPVRHALDLDAREHVQLNDAAPIRAHLLGHGPMSSLVTTTGSGSLTWNGLDINRFREDAALDAGGIYAYVRNLSSDALWSAGYHPSRTTPDSYEAAFAIERVEIHRRDGVIETTTEIAPCPEHAAEVRRFTLTNHGNEVCEVDLTTFTELVLAHRAADLSHRAFSGLFIETEALPERGALLAWRRKRAPTEPDIWVAQVLTPDDDAFGAFDFDTSRVDFVGRSGSLERPTAMTEKSGSLARKTGSVLDPALVLRRRARLKPGTRARITLTTLVADSRDEILRLLEIYSAPHAIERALELAWADARVELRHLGVTSVQAHRLQRLLSAVVFVQPALRADIDPGKLGNGGKSALWSIGLSGDLPIVVLRIDHPDFLELGRELLLAHEYSRINGIALDLVILNEEPSGYLQPLHEQALGLVRSLHAEGRIDQPGGIFVRRSEQLTEGDRNLVLSLARVVLCASKGSLGRQLKRAARQAPAAIEPLPVKLTKPKLRVADPKPARPELLFDNGLGGFTPDGREYWLLVGPGTSTPAPWCNVIANPTFGSVVSERGSSFTWYSNSQRHRLTPWSNDPVSDPSGEVIYLRDDESGAVWSATPQPAGGDCWYTVAHGQGYSRFTHTRADLEQQLTVFVSAHLPLRFQQLRLTNHGHSARRISVFGCLEWVLGGHRELSRLSVTTACDGRTLVATNPFSSFQSSCAFYTCTQSLRSFSGSREEFFGRNGSRALPKALSRSKLSDTCGPGLDPCAALHTSLVIEPGATVELSFVLGHAGNLEAARTLSAEYQSSASVQAAFQKCCDHWDETLGAVTIETPDAALDLLMNRWLLYQALSCRIWARSGFYQSSGAYGFRDQTQDVLCLVHTLPAVAREHLLRAAAQQFVEGDVQHWWHPEAGDGVRTHCSDDMLWLPYAVTEYTQSTGDLAVLEEYVPFLAERALLPGEHDLYSTPSRSAESASLYEHCARALDVSLEVGPHGLPRMGAGDWNDGMNQVGEQGTGESVWLAWFLIKALRDFAPTASARGDHTRTTRWLEHAAALTQAVEAHGWDGAWYRRAYFDDGTPMGSNAASECRIDAIAQSWATLSGTANPKRAARALRESERLLFKPDAQLMLLLWPPFENSVPSPGYIASYPAGVRENGGQYTHGILFTLRALAQSGSAESAARLLAALNPIHHARTQSEVQRYKVEPYVVAADVYSASDHFGRGGWTWYTGAAGWLYRVVLHDILGLQRSADRLTFRPCVPPTWTNFAVSYRFGSSIVHIRVDCRRSGGPGMDRLLCDGVVMPDLSLPLVDDGASHEAQLLLGAERLRSA